MEMKRHTTLVLALSFVLLYAAQVSSKKCHNPCKVSPSDEHEKRCFQLTFDSYSNPQSRRSDGSYCDGVPDTKVKVDECDTKFKICVSGMKEKCIETGYVENKDTVSYGDTIGKTPNPMTFHIKNISDAISVKISAFDRDSETVTDLIEKYSGVMKKERLYGEGVYFVYSNVYGSVKGHAVLVTCPGAPCKNKQPAEKSSIESKEEFSFFEEKLYDEEIEE